MSKKNLILILGFMIILFSCSNRIAFDKLSFGKGGGFTGKYTDYELDKKGNLYKKADNEWKLQFRIQKSDLRTISNLIKKNKIIEIDFNQAYNINNYITIKKGNVSNKLIWGDTKSPPPECVSFLFEKLMSIAGTVKK